LSGRVAAVRRGWHTFTELALESNITGMSAMIAYSMLLGIIPLALLGLFIAGQVLASQSVMRSVMADMHELFPGSTEHTLNSLLHEIAGSTTSTGLLALVVSVWLGASFWGALDTAFSKIYRCRARPWIEQKRFGLAMLVVVLLFMICTVVVPTVQSILRTGEAHLPFGLDQVGIVVYALSLLLGVIVLFGCLVVIYSQVPNRPVAWRGIWPGAAGATLAIGIVDLAFPTYLSNISTIARFGTTVVFVLIVLGWFYLLALIILGGAIVNALRLGPVQQSAAAPGPLEPTAPAPRAVAQAAVPGSD
jgi:YihY family inner membrane protein